MDLVPSPDQVISAAGNLAQILVGHEIADLRPMPRSLIDEGVLRRVHHYRPAPDAPPVGDPVLLVAPLAAPSSCYDLRRGCSLVEHLVGAGRPTYLLDYGQVPFEDRNLGMETWVEDVVPAAVRAVSAHARGRAVHLVGWSLGGTFAVLAAAGLSELPIASVTVLGTPFDVGQVPLVAPPTPLIHPELPPELAPLGWALKLLGGVPGPVKWVWGLPPVQELVAKPLSVAARLDDGEHLAQVQAVDRLDRDTVAYRGRTFGQVYHRFVRGHQVRAGAFDLDGRVVDVAAVTVPVLVVAGAGDHIAPVSSVRELVTLLTGSVDVRFEIVPGDHLGLLTGPEAREGTWPALDEWIEEWQAPAPAPVRRTRKKAATSTPPAERPAARRSTAKSPTAKSPAKRPAAKRPAAKRTGASSESIGANPTRRYGSTPSRTLAAGTPPEPAPVKKAPVRKTPVRKATVAKTAAKTPAKTTPAKTTPATKTPAKRTPAGKSTT